MVVLVGVQSHFLVKPNLGKVRFYRVEVVLGFWQYFNKVFLCIYAQNICLFLTNSLLTLYFMLFQTLSTIKKNCKTHYSRERLQFPSKNLQVLCSQCQVPNKQVLIGQN